MPVNFNLDLKLQLSEFDKWFKGSFLPFKTGMLVEDMVDVVCMSVEQTGNPVKHPVQASSILSHVRRRKQVKARKLELSYQVKNLQEMLSEHKLWHWISSSTLVTTSNSFSSSAVQAYWSLQEQFTGPLTDSSKNVFLPRLAYKRQLSFIFRLFSLVQVQATHPLVSWQILWHCG